MKSSIPRPRGALCLALATAVAAIAASPAQATFPGGPGQLAFDSFDPAGVRDVGVYTVSPDGIATARVQAPARKPQWSPSGRRILYTLDAGGNSGFWSAAPDGTEIRQEIAPAVGEQLEGAAWGPDGRTFVVRVTRRVATLQKSERAAVTSSLYVKRVDEGRRHRLWRGPEVGDPTWSPDGRLIAFVTRRRIAVIRPDGSRFRLLSAPQYVRWLDFSPDGRLLAFTEGAGRATAIRVMDIATRRTTTVVRADAMARPGAATWSPDGTELAFVWVEDGSASGAGPAWRETIHTIRPDGTGRRQRFELPPYSFVLTGLSWQAIPRVGFLAPPAAPWPATPRPPGGAGPSATRPPWAPSVISR